MREPIENEYFNWLCAKVLEPGTRNYYQLLEMLYRTEFVWKVPGDRHRVDDGLELREDFLRETHNHHDGSFEGLPCSILEVLISFAKRASFQTDIPVRDWFLHFLTNLQLDEYRRVDRSSAQIIEHILDTFIWRTYEPNGLGGLFPMRKTQHDQREREIWYQFCEYVTENDIV